MDRQQEIRIAQRLKDHLICIKVKPNSPKTEILSIDQNDRLAVAVKAPAEDNKANIVVVKLHSKFFKKQVRIKSGFKSKSKIISYNNF